MKRSTYVHLVLLGSAVTVSACDSATEELRQQAYASVDECRRDWQDPKDCQPAPSRRGAYYGPRYYWDSAVGRPVAVDPDGATRPIAQSHVTRTGSATSAARVVGSFSRGGFGSFGHAFGHGG